jgi:hypothetical protein
MDNMDAQHVYEIRQRKDKRGFDFMSDALPFGGLCYLKISDAIGYAEHHSRSRPAVIRVSTTSWSGRKRPQAFTGHG